MCRCAAACGSTWPYCVVLTPWQSVSPQKKLRLFVSGCAAFSASLNSGERVIPSPLALSPCNFYNLSLRGRRPWQSVSSIKTPADKVRGKCPCLLYQQRKTEGNTLPSEKHIKLSFKASGPFPGRHQRTPCKVYILFRLCAFWHYLSYPRSWDMIFSILPARSRKSMATKINETAKLMYRTKPKLFLGAAGVLYGSRSRTIAVQQA